LAQLFAAGGKDGSFVYSASNTCTMTIVQQQPDKCAAFSHWQRTAVPLPSGAESTGIFALASRQNFNDPMHLTLEQKRAGFRRVILAVGGDYVKPNESAGTAAWSEDDGKSWHIAATPPHGYRSSVSWSEELKAWIAVGTNGSDVSRDDGKTWQPIDDGNWNALSLPFVVGPKGRIARIAVTSAK
jgi:hypothetical protein